MTLQSRMGKEFSFIKGNYAILVVSWILIDFASEIPATYYALYVLKLGATETILGMIGLGRFPCLGFDAISRGIFGRQVRKEMACFFHDFWSSIILHALRYCTVMGFHPDRGGSD